MLVDLRLIPIHVISLDGASERQAAIHSELTRYGLGYDIVRGVEGRPSCLGISLSHLKALRRFASDPPFLVLEDDCVILDQHFRKKFEIPDETDWFYLGHTEFGLNDKRDQFGLRWGTRGNVRYDVWNNECLRIYSMLSAHAILYVSEVGVRVAQEACQKALIGHDFPINFDIECAERQTNLVAITTNDPVFYQSEAHGKGAHLSTMASIRTNGKRIG